MALELLRLFPGYASPYEMRMFDPEWDRDKRHLDQWEDLGGGLNGVASALFSNCRTLRTLKIHQGERRAYCREPQPLCRIWTRGREWGEKSFWGWEEWKYYS